MLTGQFPLKSPQRIRAFFTRIFRQKNAGPNYWPQVGDRVVIFYLGLGGPLIEGWADIVAFGPVHHQFHVRFIGETETRRRFVNPEWQRLPDCSLALLKAFWRSQRGDDLFYDAAVFDDLFFDDPHFEDQFLDVPF